MGPDPKTGRALGRSDIVDHQLSWSVYFSDPDDNRLEVTTYDYDSVTRMRRPNPA